MKFIIPPALIFLLLFAGKTYYDTNTIEVKHFEISHSPLGEVLAGLKVAHLSDLHIKKIGLRENKILEILKEEKPDLILATGDFIGFKGPYESVLAFNSHLYAPLGVYAVLGNTEYSNENGSCILCHEERSKGLKKNQHPIFLRNSSFPLKVNGRTLNILGVDDPVSKRSNLEAAPQGKGLNNPTILLAHSPEIFEEASHLGIDLLLCGHTHGGQLFGIGYLQKLFPLIDPAIEFLDGFFQKGKTLMYVSRGVGNSFLPFRFGVKPEITFFSFSVNPSNSMNPSNPSTPVISNTLPTKIFTGFNFTSLIETFNILNLFNISGSTHSTNLSREMRSLSHQDPMNSKILFDFESDSDLEGLSWECHKWFERSETHVTSGKYSLKVMLPPGQYSGFNFRKVPKDWPESNFLKVDIYNPFQERFNFHIRIDDHKSGWEYANRFDKNFELKPGINHLTIPTHSIRTNIHKRPLNLKKIECLIVFLPDNPKKREIYIDNIRLE